MIEILITGRELWDRRSRERDLPLLEDLPESFSLVEFDKRNLPAVVACFGCTMTMVLFSARIEDGGDRRVWCVDCVGEES
jgi:hypothetical protein